MTQEEHLDGGHRVSKPVYDQNNDDAASSSRKISAKNSGKKNPKIQQADRKINQSNKSVIRKTSASCKEPEPLVNRDRKNRDKIGGSNKSTVGNQNERVGATAERNGDKDAAADMTVISQQTNGGLRESIPSDVIDSAKISPAADAGAEQLAEIDSGVGLRVAEATPTAINTDLQDNGADGGIGPTNENNNTTAVERKATDEGHSEASPETHADDICAKEPKEFTLTVKEGSCLQPLPKTDDPIARLNALRANISNALKEVKAVLDQHAPPLETPSGPAEGKDKGDEGEGCVQFRFVRRAPKKHVIKFDDEEIICAVPCEVPANSEKTNKQDTPAPVDQGDSVNNKIDSKHENESANAQKADLTESVADGSGMKIDDKPLHRESSPNTKSKNKTAPKSSERSKALEAAELALTNHHEEKSSDSGKSVTTEDIFQVKVIESANELPTSAMDIVTDITEETILKPYSESEDKTVETSNKRPQKAQKTQLTKPEKGEAKNASNESVNHEESIKKSKLGTKIPQPKNANQKLVNIITQDLPKNKASAEMSGKSTSKLNKQPLNETTHLHVDAKMSKPTAVSGVDHKQLKTSETYSNETENSFPTNKRSVTTEPISPLDTTLMDHVNLPTKLPKKTPVEKCVNVEIAALEILNRNQLKDVSSQNVGNAIGAKVAGHDSIQDSCSPIQEALIANLNDNIVKQEKPHLSETKIPKATNKGIKSSFTMKEPETSTTDEGGCAQKIALNDTSIATETCPPRPSNQGGMLSKPPLNLRVKRASFTESSKDPPKSKIAKPKRASIGSESELTKLASEQPLPTKDATKPTLGDKPLTVTESEKNDKAAAVSSGNNALLGKNSGCSGVPTKPNSSSSVESTIPSTSKPSMKSSLSGASKIESLAEIVPTLPSSASATVTQPIPIESIEGAKIAPELSPTTPGVGSPLISSSDKLASSKSAELSGPISVAGSPPKMTVVKKDKVPSIASKQSLEELNDKVKQSEIITDSLDCNVNVLAKLSADSINQVESLLKANEDKTTARVKQNGEVLAGDIEKSLRLQSLSKVRKVKHVEVPKKNAASLHSDENQLPTEVLPSRLDQTSKSNGQVLGVEKPTISDDNVISTSSKALEVADGASSFPQTIESQPAVASEKSKNQDAVNVASDTSLLAPSEAESSPPEPNSVEAVPQPNEHLASTTTESSLSEAEKDGTSAPKVKKTRKTKKVVIRRVKRKLSRDGSLEEKVEPEICEKPIADPLHPTEEAVEEPIEEEPVVPKAPKSCLVKRSYEPGQMVLYADRVKKSVKWKQAKVIEKITDNSYKLEFDGAEKPAHISYIKKFTEKKVQFGGKEYLEIDYQQEYESSSEEEAYNIWARV